MKTPGETPSLFVWRSEQRNSIRDGGHVEWRLLKCRWCDTHLRDLSHALRFGWSGDDEQVCQFCGWSHRCLMTPYDEHNSSGDQFYFWKELREFIVSDQRIALSELGTHLQRRFSDVYSLAPRRFEELIEDVFRSRGFRTCLTPTSRDDGVDIYLLERDGSPDTLIEVKRYAGHRKVGLAVVDRLLGVQLRKGVQKAVLVTSSSFSEPAQAAAETVSSVSSVSLELIDANALLQLLGVYNEDLPPLPEVIRAWERSVPK